MCCDALFRGAVEKFAVFQMDRWPDVAPGFRRRYGMGPAQYIRTLATTEIKSRSAGDFSFRSACSSMFREAFGSDRDDWPAWVDGLLDRRPSGLFECIVPRDGAEPVLLVGYQVQVFSQKANSTRYDANFCTASKEAARAVSALCTAMLDEKAAMERDVSFRYTQLTCPFTPGGNSGDERKRRAQAHTPQQTVTPSDMEAWCVKNLHAAVDARLVSHESVIQML